MSAKNQILVYQALINTDLSFTNDNYFGCNLQNTDILQDIPDTTTNAVGTYIFQSGKTQLLNCSDTEESGFEFIGVSSTLTPTVFCSIKESGIEIGGVFTGTSGDSDISLNSSGNITISGILHICQKNNVVYLSPNNPIINLTLLNGLTSYSLTTLPFMPSMPGFIPIIWTNMENSISSIQVYLKVDADGVLSLNVPSGIILGAYKLNMSSFSFVIA